MAYTVKEALLTLQGEGARTGRTTVLCRFAGCNLWSGHERDRATAPCRFCDTGFVGVDGPGGGRFGHPADLAGHLRSQWDATASGGVPYVVFTGGEPTLQLDAALVEACHALGMELAVETNGTRRVPEGIDWVTVSPKPGPEPVQRSGDELKLAFPQPEWPPDRLEAWDFEHFFLQPIDGPAREANTAAAMAYCLRHPRWRLSLQTHKLLGIP